MGPELQGPRAPVLECGRRHRLQEFFVARGRYGDDIVQKIEYLACARSRRGVLASGKAVQVSGGWSNGAGLTLPVRSQAKKIAIAKRRFKDQRRISWQGVGPAIFWARA